MHKIPKSQVFCANNYHYIVSLIPSMFDGGLWKMFELIMSCMTINLIRNIKIKGVWLVTKLVFEYYMHYVCKGCCLSWDVVGSQRYGVGTSIIFFVRWFDTHYCTNVVCMEFVLETPNMWPWIQVTRITHIWIMAFIGWNHSSTYSHIELTTKNIPLYIEMCIMDTTTNIIESLRFCP